MTDREKLIALLKVDHCHGEGIEDCYECVYSECDDCYMARTADALLANGVTVQRWIPVTERLPEVGADILVCHKNGFVATNAWLGTHWWFKDDKNTITHWMPLPEPPKEGE